MKASFAAMMILVGSAVRAGDLSPSVPRFNPHFPVLGGGKFVNIFDSDAALTNASAHVAWALALPMAGAYVGGRKGLWISGVSWMALTVVQEALFHAPARPGAGYPAEVRADLLTRLVPTAAVLAWDLLRGHGSGEATPAVMPGPMRPLQDLGRAQRTPTTGWLCPDVPPLRPPVQTAAVTH